MSRLMYGIHASEVKPAEAAARFAPRPLLVIHGDADELIPVASAGRIWHARYGEGTPDPATYYVVPGAGHTQAYKSGNAAYLALVGNFFEQHLK
jgi:fermentation-respiration switch protein FrsA (DUF1100 family)